MLFFSSVTFRFILATIFYHFESLPSLLLPFCFLPSSPPFMPSLLPSFLPPFMPSFLLVCLFSLIFYSIFVNEKSFTSSFLVSFLFFVNTFFFSSIFLSSISLSLRLFPNAQSLLSTPNTYFNILAIFNAKLASKLFHNVHITSGQYFLSFQERSTF